MPAGIERDGVSHHLPEQFGIALEQVLVEIVVGDLARAESEGPFEPATPVDKGGKPLYVHYRQSGATAKERRRIP